MRNIFIKAHKLTREIKAQYPEVDYRTQFGINLSYLLNNKDEEEMITFTKGNLEFILTNLDYNRDNLVCDISINNYITTKGSFEIFINGKHGFGFNPAININGNTFDGVSLPENIEYKELRQIALNSGKEMDKDTVIKFQLDPVKFGNHENTKTVKQLKNQLTPKIAHRVGVELKKQGYVVHQSHTSFGYTHTFECTVERLEQAIENAKNYRNNNVYIHQVDSYGVAE